MNRTARSYGAGIACCLAGLLVAAITGCSSASSTSKAAATATGPSPSTVLSSSPIAPTALNAKALNSQLLPVSDMPNGYSVNKPSTVYDGEALPVDTPSPVPASQICDTLSQTAWVRAAGINTADFAEADFLNSSHTEEISEEIDAFPGTDAQTVMTALWQAFGSCKNFTQSSNGVTATVTLTRSALDGMPAGIRAVEVSPQFQGGETLVAIRVGYAIVTVLDSSEGSDNGSGAVSMAERIASRLSAAETAK